MNDQIKMKQMIPDFVLLFVIALLFGLMALPHSQYSLLSEMSILSTSGNTTLDLGIVLPSIFTLFVVLCGAATGIFALLCLIINSFYTFHFVNKVCVILGGVTGVLELLYLFFGLGNALPDGTEIIQAGNVVSVVLYLVGFIAYVVLFALYISKPFLEIKREMMNTPSSPTTPYHDVEEEEVETKPEEKVTSASSSDKNEAQKKMREVILEEVASGKLSPEEASTLLEKLDK